MQTGAMPRFIILVCTSLLSIGLAYVCGAWILPVLLVTTFVLVLFSTAELGDEDCTPVIRPASSDVTAAAGL